jgi:hypothetical protein
VNGVVPLMLVLCLVLAPLIALRGKHGP